MRPPQTPRYALPGPCLSWVFQGRDDRWYRVCVPCDVHPDRGPRIPNHLAYGWRNPGDATMSARDHVRAVETNRHTWKRALERERNIIWAAMHGDDLLFGQLITGDPNWAPGEHSTLEERQEIMADYLRSRDH